MDFPIGLNHFSIPYMRNITYEEKLYAFTIPHVKNWEKAFI